MRNALSENNNNNIENALQICANKRTHMQIEKYFLPPRTNLFNYNSVSVRTNTQNSCFVGE